MAEAVKGLRKMMKDIGSNNGYEKEKVPAATAGYMNAAIRFEKVKDLRSALACVYRNARYRLRDNQLAQLDEDLIDFDVDAAGIDTMLAVLTVTAPVKSKLPNRRRVFRQIKARLKSCGQLEKGLLDDLK